MAKSVFFLALLVVALVCAQAKDDDKKLKCYQCKNCTDIGKEKATDCADGLTACYITGNPEKEDWERGCTTNDKLCDDKKDTDKYACSTCTSDECNSGAFVTGSIVLSLGLAAIVNMMH